MIVPAKAPSSARTASAWPPRTATWRRCGPPSRKRRASGRSSSAGAPYRGLPQELGLPSAPKQFIQYFDDPTHPQTRLDRDYENGMGISLGRLRGDSLFDYRFVGLSHNTVRGAAGGAVLIAELLVKQGYIPKK